MLKKFITSIKLITLEPYIFFCFLGYLARLSSFQNLLIDRACRNIYEYPDEICNNLDKHETEQSICIKRGDNLYMYAILLNSLPAIVVAILLGPWSDKYSKRYPLIIAVSGMFLESVSGVALTFFNGLSPIWFAAVALFSGLTGGLMISASATYSYISDITDEKSRPARFALIEFSGILAIICGTLLGGQIYKAYGYLAVMSISPISFLLALLYAIFVVKETKPPVPEGKRCQMFKDLLTIDNVKQSYKTCARKRAGNIRCQIWSLVWIGATQQFIDMGTLAVGFPFAKKMYHWTVTEFSYASTIYYVVNAFMVIVIIPLLSIKLRVHEAAIGLVGVLSTMAKMVLTSVAFTAPYFYLGWLSGTICNASGIAVKSRLSKIVHKDELGRAFSLQGMIESITPLLGTVVFLEIYNASLNIFPGLAFVIGAVIVLPCAIMFGWMMRMPTISLAEYIRAEEMRMATPMGNVSSNYQKLEEQGAVY